MGDQDQGSEGSVVNSSSTTNLWDLHHGSSLSSWSNNVISWHTSSSSHHAPTVQHHHNSNSSNTDQEEISISPSFTNSTSNHSGVTEDSSRRIVDPTAAAAPSEITGEPASENHLWSQVLLSVGSNGDLHNTHDVGENFLEVLSSKNLSTAMFDPACDYLKKMDSWDYASSPNNYNNIERHLNGFNNNNGGFLEQERLNNLSNLVSNWSIAPPYPDDINRQITLQQTRNMSLMINSMDHNYTSSSADHHPHDVSHHHQMKQSLNNSTSSYGVVQGHNGNSGFFPCYGHDQLKEDSHVQQHDEEMESSEDTSFQRLLKSNNMRHHLGNNSSAIGENKYYYGESESSWPSTRSLSDTITFNGCMNKQLMDLQPSNNKPCNLKTTSSTSSAESNKKQGQTSSSQARGSGRTGASIEGKKKRCEDQNSETQFKKPKHETSQASSVKAQVPKVKMADRVTALQQIVSPFGKTDTASVLQEAIGYIKFLQEQVQLLSNPYMKSSANKDPWGMLERKDKGAEAKFDLKSRGLCLVPVSCTPQVYRDNTGSDYWTPVYRGCLYR
ncbi:hypothetical protein Syun_022456 [Stephania yunnanensis]|uniref:BHLH domain-containing protein n=1 Tax=Stephania yunnanensis TaxID=152371 RepID=A0AAP0F9J6_9MAGN